MFPSAIAWSIFATIFSVCRALSDVKVIIPAAVKLGDSATLECHYNLDGDRLYSVKWYKGAREFYRYNPYENPQIKEFPVVGISVSLKESNGTQLVLNNVSLETEGQFSCEVTADEPSFYTDLKSSNLLIVQVPKQEPIIKGVKSRYHPGEILRAECISSESRPAVNLTWLVNEAVIEASRIRHHQTRSEVYGSDLVNTNAVLRLAIGQQLFVNGKLKIRCVAQMHNVYQHSSEKTVYLINKSKHIVSPTNESTSTTTEDPIGWILPGAERHPSVMNNTNGRGSRRKLEVAIAILAFGTYLCVR